MLCYSHDSCHKQRRFGQDISNNGDGKERYKKPVKLQGEWILDSAAGYQFKTELSYENGKQIIEIDSPSFLGGNGNIIGPMGYCVAGIASCFIATFVTVAAGQGIRLTKLTANVECKINFAKTFDVSNEPITEGITFRIDAVSDNADKSKLQQLLKMAEERCPAVYSMSHIINVEATVNWVSNNFVYCTIILRILVTGYSEYPDLFQQNALSFL